MADLRWMGGKFRRGKWAEPRQMARWNVAGRSRRASGASDGGRTLTVKAVESSCRVVVVRKPMPTDPV